MLFNYICYKNSIDKMIFLFTLITTFVHVAGVTA
jgi:hypothetical protein